MDTGFILCALGSGVLLTLSRILYIEALSESDMSITIPMVSISPLFLLVLAALLLGEVPSIVGVLGVVLITSGTYLFGVSGSTGGAL